MIDIRQLTIGSHVEFEGKLHKVMEVRSDGSVTIGRYTNFHGECMPTEGAKVKGGIYKCRYIIKNYSCSDIQPVAITPELLKELGFEYHEYDNGNLWEWRFDDLYKAYGYLEFDEDTTTLWRGRLWHMKEIETEFRVEYLHELENLFYMFYEKELIPN